VLSFCSFDGTLLLLLPLLQSVGGIVLSRVLLQ